MFGLFHGVVLLPVLLSLLGPEEIELKEEIQNPQDQQNEKRKKQNLEDQNNDFNVNNKGLENDAYVF